MRFCGVWALLLWWWLAAAVFPVPIFLNSNSTAICTSNNCCTRYSLQQAWQCHFCFWQYWPWFSECTKTIVYKYGYENFPIPLLWLSHMSTIFIPKDYGGDCWGHCPGFFQCYHRTSLRFRTSMSLGYVFLVMLLPVLIETEGSVTSTRSASSMARLGPVHLLFI